MKTRRYMGSWPYVMALVASSTLGCSGQAVDLGPLPGSMDSGPIVTVPPSLAGTWTASASGAEFLSPPKPLRLELEANGNGTLLVGQQELPPPTDPAVGSPPEAEADAAQSTVLSVHLYEGVNYTLTGVQTDGTHLHFVLDAAEAFDPLCAIEPSLLTDVGYRCIENWGGGVRHTGSTKRCFQTDPDTGVDRDVDCLVVTLCQLDAEHGCACTDSGCTTNHASAAHALFDLTLSADGNTLSGQHQMTDEPGLVPSIPEDVTFSREAN